MLGLGVPESWLPRLATLKAAGAVGLVVGLWVPLLGAVAGAFVLRGSTVAVGGSVLGSLARTDEW
ncbi:DoxX family protein [Streptomyces sp. NPDC059896]|uniref:DoxX family protein n=1 Tax=Streptomyces sp. NPDC059896 TaxID=3346993 RepID=UPI003646BB49